MSNLEHVEVGDHVKARAHRLGGGPSYDLLLVERLTRTQIITENGTRWRKLDGDEVGGRTGFHSRSIEPTTSIEIEAIKADHRNYRIRSYVKHYEKWNDVSIDGMTAIYKILKEEESKS